MKCIKIQNILITIIALTALSACGGDKNESLTEKAVNKTKDIANSAKNKAGDIKDAAVDAGKGAIDSAKEKAGDTIDAAKDAGHSAMEKAGDMKDSAIDAGKNAIETAKDKTGDVVDAAKDAGHSAMEKAGGMKDSAVDAGKDTVAAVKEKTGNAIDAAKNAVGMDGEADNAEDAIKAAKESQAAAKKLGFEWRDMGKMIKKAEALAKEGKSDKAMSIANTIAAQIDAIKKQAELAKTAGPQF